MDKREWFKITVILFHVLVLFLLFVSVSLSLDELFNYNTTIDLFGESLNFSTVKLFSLFSICLGAISCSIITVKWLKNKQLVYYLKTILLTKSILIIISILII